MPAGTANSIVVSENTTSLATWISGGGWERVDSVVDGRAIENEGKTRKPEKTKAMWVETTRQ